MDKQTAISSRDLGLEFAAICGRYFLGLEHLHYGYWPDDLPVQIHNLRAAQEHYTDFLLSHIPAGVHKILDVGCGSGQTSKRLAEMGYEVACVSPSPVLSQRVRKLMGDSSQVFECKYEKVQTCDKFDLVLFSESFQYVNLAKAFEKTLEVLKPAGYLLICDVFRKDIETGPGEKGVGGGHRLGKFQTAIAKHPLEQVEYLDITGRTAPNLDLLDDALKNVVRPIVDSTINFLGGRYPLMSKFLRWKYRRRIDTVYGKYFNGHRTSEDFEKFKCYQLLLYRNTCAVPVEASKSGDAPAHCRTICSHALSSPT